MPTCRSTQLIVCAGALSIALACSHGQPQEAATAEPPATQGGETAGAASRMAGTSSAAASAKVVDDGRGQDEPLTDTEIMGVADVVNSAEIDQAMVAQRKASAPQIRAYAEGVIADHRQAKASIAALAEREGTPPITSSLATDFSEQAAGIIESLRNGRSGERFDRMYIETQLRQLRNVLNLLDGKLIPNAQDERLETELLRLRAMVDRHLTRARNIDLTL